MCGRYVLPNEDLIADNFTIHESRWGFELSYNVAPTQTVPVIRREPEGRVLDGMRWGLVPSWAKDLAIGARAINARAETLSSKPMFRAAYKSRRCIVPAAGFYEWQVREHGKVPHFIHRADGKPMAFAGLWESWRSPEDVEVLTCTIVTTSPNDVMQPLHDRMPVVLDDAAMRAWLDPASPPDALASLLVPYAGALEAYPVTTAVGSPRVNTPELIERVDAEAAPPPPVRHKRLAPREPVQLDLGAPAPRQAAAAKPR